MVKKPNVVLINCDDMGYGDLGCYGSDKNSTPVIDQLASEGVKLTSFYAASPVCSPSRAALMTGCYPPRVNINSVLFPGEAKGLNTKEYTLGNLFKDNGYASKIVGKWHVGDQKEYMPTNYGFDEYYGLPYSNDMGVQSGEKPRRVYPPLPLIEGDEVIEEQPDQRSLTARYTEQCRKFIRKNAEEPFFLYMAHMHMHLPHYCAEPFMVDSKNGDYGGCISEVDWSVKGIIYELKKQGVYDNTVIIFTSDNGSRSDHGASNGQLRGTKFTTFEGGQRVPCIIKWKGQIEAGSVNDGISSQIDLLPTLASMINDDKGNVLEKRPASRQNDIDGLDITKQICGDEVVRDTFVYMGSSDLSVNKPVICAVRKGQWKLHLKRIDVNKHEYEYVNELYNLDEDTSEEDNCLETYPEKVDELTKILLDYESSFGDYIKEMDGTQVRQCSSVDNPSFLTEYDENHPYIIAMYDKHDRG